MSKIVHSISYEVRGSSFDRIVLKYSKYPSTHIYTLYIPVIGNVNKDSDKRFVQLLDNILCTDTYDSTN